MKKTTLFTILMVFIISYGNAQWSGQVHYPTSPGTTEYGNNTTTPIGEDYNSFVAPIQQPANFNEFFVFAGARRTPGGANTNVLDFTYLNTSTGSPGKTSIEVISSGGSGSWGNFHDKLEPVEALYNPSNQHSAVLIRAWQNNGPYPDEFYSYGIAEFDNSQGLGSDVFVSWDGVFEFENLTFRADRNNPGEYFVAYDRRQSNSVVNYQAFEGIQVAKLDPTNLTFQPLTPPYINPNAAYSFEAMEYDDQTNVIYFIASTVFLGNDVISILRFNGTTGNPLGVRHYYLTNFNSTFNNVHTAIDKNGVNPPLLYIGFDSPNNGIGILGVDYSGGAVNSFEITDPNCDYELTSMRYQQGGELHIGAMSRNCAVDAPYIYPVPSAISSWPPASPLPGRWLETSPPTVYNFADFSIDGNGHRLLFGYSDHFPVTGTPPGGVRNNIRTFDFDNLSPCYTINSVPGIINSLSISSLSAPGTKPYTRNEELNYQFFSLVQLYAGDSDYENCVGGTGFYKKDPNTTSTAEVKVKNELQNYEVVVYDLVGHKLTEEQVTSKNMKELKVAVRQKLRNTSNINSQMLLVVVSNENGERIDSYKEIQF